MSIDEIDQAMLQMKRAAGSRNASSRRRKPSRTPRSIPGMIMVFIVLILLPFFVLVRSSMFLYLDQGFNEWMALGIGGVATTIVLTLYIGIFGRYLWGRFAFSGGAAKVTGAIVLVYLGYSLLYISSVNVKTDSVRATYRSLHPLLRVATSTLVLADRSLVVTDGGRVPADYARMGLPVQENSKHFKQPGGYVEAVDIRTRGRSEITNFMVRSYFRMMGFNTLRHVGTADHLHISMPSR